MRCQDIRVRNSNSGQARSRALSAGSRRHAVPRTSTKTELGCCIALFGNAAIPSGCLGEVLGRADADVVGEADFVLRFGIAALCAPPQCISAILLFSASGSQEFVVVNSVTAADDRVGTRGYAHRSTQSSHLKARTTGADLHDSLQNWETRRSS